MIRRGVPQKTAMKVSGHKTDAIFSRYNIVSEADLRDAVRKIEQGAKAQIHSSFTVAQGCSNSEEAAESAEALVNERVRRTSRSGGTGRRAGLKIQWYLVPCGFDPLLRDHSLASPRYASIPLSLRFGREPADYLSPQKQ